MTEEKKEGSRCFGAESAVPYCCGCPMCVEFVPYSVNGMLSAMLLPATDGRCYMVCPECGFDVVDFVKYLATEWLKDREEKNGSADSP